MAARDVLSEPTSIMVQPELIVRQSMRVIGQGVASGAVPLTHDVAETLRR